MRQVRFWVVSSLALPASLVLGCTYLSDRGRDLTDCGGVEFYAGQGGLVNARATKLVQAGLGAFDGDIVHCGRRAIAGTEEIRAEAGIGPYYYTVYDRTLDWVKGSQRNWASDPNEYGKVHWNPRDPNDRRFYEIGVSVAAFLGVGVNVDLFQIFDFVLGIFTIDIGKDDACNREVPDVGDPRYKPIGERPLTGPVPEAGM